MSNFIKGFNSYVNEAKFYHSLPQGEGRLRDKYRALSAKEQDEISDLAKKLDDLNLLQEFKRTLSKYRTIADLKKGMEAAISSESSFKDWDSSRAEFFPDRETRLEPNRIDMSSIEIGGIEPWDRPDYVDAHLAYAEFKDGTPLTDEELDELVAQYPDWFYEVLMSRLD